MASRSIGTLTIDLVAKTGGFIQGMDKAERNSKKWRNSVENDLNTISKAASRTALALGVGLAGSVTAMTLSGLKSVDTQAKLARSLNTTFDSVTQLNKAFDDEGISDFEGSLSRLNRRLGAAELGRGAALNAVKELNLDLKELSGMDAAERIATIADRIQAVATNSQTAARYAQDLGFQQKEAAHFFLRGGDAIRQAGEYVNDMGLSMSALDVEKIEQAASIFSGFSDTTKAISQNLAASFAPVITAVNNALLDTSKELGGVQNKTDDLVEWLVEGFAFGVDAVDGFNRVIQVAGRGIAIFGLSAKDVMLTVARSIIDFPTAATNEFIDVLNKLPKVNIEKFGFSDLSKSINDEIKLTRQAINIGWSDINDVLLKEQPSKTIIAEFEKAKLAATEAAEKMLEERKKYQYGFEAANDEENEGTKKTQKTYLELMATYDETVAAGLRYQQQVEAINDSTATYEQKLELITLAQAEFNKTLAESDEQGYWEKWLEGAEKALSSFDDMAKTVLDNFSSGFGNAFEQMVFDSTSFKDAMQSLAVNMSRSIVNALGQMAAQWLAYQAVQLLVGKTTQSAATTALISNAQASVFQAGLNAYTSTAAIPIVGPAAAPGALATAIAATEPLAAAVQATALAGMAHDGIDNIPQDGTWLLQEGERVVDRRTNADLKNYLNGKNTGGVVVNLYEDKSRAGQVEEGEDDNENKVIDIFVADLLGDGRTAETLQRKFGLSSQGY